MFAADPASVVPAFLDDTYLIGTPEAIQAGLEALKGSLLELDLALRPEKTQVWAPEQGLVLPDSLEAYRRPELKAVGSVILYASRSAEDIDADWRGVPVDVLLSPHEDQGFLQRQGRYFDRLLL